MDTVRALIGDEYPIEIPLHFGRYEYAGPLASGAFSIVVLVRLRGANTLFACKVCSRRLLLESEMFDRFERELRILQSLNHPNLVRLFDVVYETDLIYLIMEYCPNGELYGLITGPDRLGEPEVRRIFIQLVDAMIYIHSRSVAHRDIKPENILIDQNMNPKIGDFGLCQHTNATLMKTPCGSLFYAPPEVLGGKEYDGKLADVWSLGVVLFVMVTGTLPWPTTSQTNLMNLICRGAFTIPSTFSESLDSLLSRMIVTDPSVRMTMAEVAKHPWVSLTQSIPRTPVESVISTARTSDALRLPHMERRMSGTLKKVVMVRPTESTIVTPLFQSAGTRQILKKGPQTMSLKPPRLLRTPWTLPPPVAAAETP
jgi:serine/threonine protein kinase